MHFFKSFKTLVTVLILATMWGCSGEYSTAPASNAKQAKATGKSLTNDKQITNDNLDQGQPATAYDNVNNQYLVVWTHTNQDGSNDIKGQIYKGSGGSLPAPAIPSSLDAVGGIIDITTAAGNQTQPKAAFDKTTGKYLVIWSDTRNAGTVLSAGPPSVIAGSIISGQLLSSTGQLLTRAGAIGLDVFNLSTQNAHSYSQTEPDLVYNPARNNFVAAWLDATDADTANAQTVTGYTCSNSVTINYIPLPTSDTNMVRTIEIAPSNGATSNLQNISRLLTVSDISDNIAASTFTATWSLQRDEAKPRVVVAPSGEYFTAWSGKDKTVTLSMPYVKGTPVAPAVTAPCAYQAAVFTSSAEDSQNKIKVRKDSGFGLFKDYPFGALATYPAVAVDPNTNRLFIAWEEQALPGNLNFKSIQGQMIDLSNFTNYGSQINISSGTTGDRSSPVVAFDNVNQRFLVTWEDARNSTANLSNMDIYAQFIDPQGQLSGGNTLVTVASGNQLAPAVVFGGPLFRQFLVIWKDGRASSNADIFGQLMEFSLMPQLTIIGPDGSAILNGAYNFGTETVGQTSTAIFKLRNDGNATLNIFDHNSLPSPYSFATQFPQQVSIAPGTTFDLAINFAPTANGSYAGTSFLLDINSDGGNSKMYLSGSGSGASALQISNTALPDGQPNVAYTTTIQGTGGAYPYTWSLSGNPAWLSIDSTGILSGVPPASGSFPFIVSLSDNNFPNKNSTTKDFTLTVGAISITTAALADASTGVAYSQSLAQAGATAPLTWSLANNTTLPDGLEINPTSGVISGTPTKRGTFNFSIKLTGANGSTTKNFTINADTPLSIDAATLSAGALTQSYQQTLTAQGGRAPYTWSILSPNGGALPDGLQLAPNTGALSGTPTAAGTFNFIVKVTDADTKTATRTFSITVTSSASSGNGSIQFYNGTSQISSLSFDNVYKSASSKKTVTIKNTSNSAVSIASISCSNSAFYVSSVPFTIIANGSATADVTFTPASIQSYSGTLDITDSNGSKFQLPISGTGIGANVVLKDKTAGTVSYINTVATSSLPTQNKPTDFTVQATAEFEITGVNPKSTVTVSVTFENMPSSPIFYKLDSNNNWIQLTGATVSGNVVTFDVADDSDLDLDKTPGIIKDPIILGTNLSTITSPATVTSTSGGGGGGGCFIATAAFGSYLDPHVMVLRHFRDDVLLQSELGTAFVKFYYKHSPQIADFIAQHDSLRMIMRFALTPLIFAVKYPLIAALLFAIAGIWFIRRKLLIKSGEGMAQQAG